MPVFASEPKIGRTDGKILTAGRMGILLAEVKDGKLVKTTNALPQTVENHLQQTGPSQVHTRARIKYPMVRKGYLANPSNPQGVRGKDEYVRVSWEEAYKLVNEQHSRIRKTYGAEGILLALTVGTQVAHCMMLVRCYNVIWGLLVVMSVH